MLKIFVVSLVLIILVILALSVRIIFVKKGEFRGGSCKNKPSSIGDTQISCGCGKNEACSSE